MSLYLVTPPARDVVDLDEVKEHLREDGTDQDGVIEALIDAVTGHVDGAGWLQRALIDQTWDYKLDLFPCRRFITLPLPPLIEVESVKYIDKDGVEQTYDAASYRVTGIAGSNCGRIHLKSSSCWPVTACAWLEAVTIRFRAGYLDTSFSPPEDRVPPSIKAAIKLWIGTLYLQRETLVLGQSAIEIPWGAEALLSQFRVYG